MRLGRWRAGLYPHALGHIHLERLQAGLEGDDGEVLLLGVAVALAVGGRLLEVVRLVGLRWRRDDAAGPGGDANQLSGLVIPPLDRTRLTAETDGTVRCNLPEKS